LERYTLSLHDALPICRRASARKSLTCGVKVKRNQVSFLSPESGDRSATGQLPRSRCSRSSSLANNEISLRSASQSTRYLTLLNRDRKSTRLNSSHSQI